MKLTRIHAFYDAKEIVIAYNDNPMNPVRRAILNADKTLSFENEGCEEIKDLVLDWASNELYFHGFSGRGTPLRYTKQLATASWKKYSYEEANEICHKKSCDLVFSYLIKGKDAKIKCGGNEMTQVATYVWHD